MDVAIVPSALGGKIPAIASKSVAHRVLILAAFADQISDINCSSSSKDIEATINCLEALGARIAKTKQGFRVRPIKRRSLASARLNCSESGSTFRFMIPICAALRPEFELTGEGRLGQRPLAPLDAELMAAGAELTHPKESFTPLRVKGLLSHYSFELPGNVSSQYVTGLLMAGAIAGKTTQVKVVEPVESAAYIQLSIDALELFGQKVEVTSLVENDKKYRLYSLSAAPLKTPSTITVEGDWSNAAFWLAAGAISGEMCVSNLNAQSHQGDRAFFFELLRFGAHAQKQGLDHVVKAAPLKGQTIDVSEIPDLVPPLALVACFADTPTHIVGASRLRLKESDRLESVAAALNALGGSVQIENDSLIIQPAKLTGGRVDAANDHRIAMMSAIGAAFASGPSVICGADCVAKSYPNFFEDFAALGGTYHCL